MWARVVEIMTAVWLAVSPWVFRAESDVTLIWADMALAAVIWLLAGLSYWPPTRYAHLLILVVAVGLIVWGRVAGTPPPPIHQNHIVVGLFLLMMAIVPNEASQPPKDWRTSR